MKNILLFSIVLLIGCSDGAFKALSSGEERLQCPAKSSLALNNKVLKNAYEKSGKKVLFLNTTTQSNLPKDFEFSVLVDRQCAARVNGLSFLSKEAKKLPKKDYNKFSKVDAFTVKLPTAMSKLDIEKIAAKDSCVKGVTEETYAKLQSIPNDPLFGNQSYMPSIRYNEIYADVFTSSKKLTGEYIVAVIDTGFLLTHPDLVNRYWVNPREIPGNGIDDDNNGVIDDINGSNQNRIPPFGDPSSVNYSQHGTHVAGFIGAELNNNEGISGILGLNAKIMGINAWPFLVGSGDPNANPPMSVIDRGIRYAVDNGARVINISMQGEGYHPNIEDAMIYAASKNVVVVVAAGNNNAEIGDDHLVGVPAVYSKDIAGAISVAATNSANGNIRPEICIFSNYSADYVEIGAPGCDPNTFTSYGGYGILSCVPPDTDPSGYGYIQGTSMASPVAAGGAIFTYAILKELAGLDPTAALVEEVMKNGSAANANLVGKTLNSKHLDLKGIYDYVQATYVNPVGPTPSPGDCE
jgi:subtilisin family serine protease